MKGKTTLCISATDLLSKADCKTPVQTCENGAFRRIASMAKRVLHILSTPRAEGTPNLVLDWLTAGTDHWQGVVVLNSQPADLTDRLRAVANAYEEHNLFDGGYRKFFGIASVACAAVRKYRPDVLVCWP